MAKYFDEETYLDTYPDVADAVRAGVFANGYDHFKKHGEEEGRKSFFKPSLSSKPNFYKECEQAGLDIWKTLNRLQLVHTLGLQDIKARYRRTLIGPLWITVSTSVMITCIGTVFGGLFGTPMDTFLPFLAVSLILWQFFLGSISEGCTSFIDAQGIIKQVPVPFFIHVLRTIWRNFLILLHNVWIIPFVFLIMGLKLSLTSLLALPGLLLTIACLSWLSLFLAILCSRYRDMPQLVSSFMQVVFYLTPVIWMPSLLPDRLGTAILDLNPFYHLIEITRGPLLGNLVSAKSWSVVAAISLIGWLVTFILFTRTRNKIAYWV